MFRPVTIPVIAMLLLVLTLVPAGAGDGAASADLALSAAHPSQGASLHIVENVGQFASGARFQMATAQGTLWLADDALWLTVPSATAPSAAVPSAAAPSAAAPSASAPAAAVRPGTHLKLSFPGARTSPRLEPAGRLNTRVSYFLGHDQADWQSSVPVWSSVRYRDLYPGVDLEISGETGVWQWRWVTRAGASAAASSLAALQLRVEGAEGVAVDQGRLRLTMAGRSVEVPLPAAVDDRGQAVAVGAAEVAGSTVRSPVGPTTAPVADPVLRAAGEDDLIYSTFLGGDGDVEEYIQTIAVDATGAAYVAGITLSPTFPTTPGSYQPAFGDKGIAFVAKFNPAGSALVYATYLNAYINEIAVDGSGAAYLAGQGGTDTPTTPGVVQPTLVGDYDAYVAKLHPSGSSLIFATFIGGVESDPGNGWEIFEGLGVGPDGTVYLAGTTSAADFPTTVGAYDRGYNGNDDIVVIHLNATGSALLYSSYLGGSSTDSVRALAVDGLGAVYLTGYTESDNLPVTDGAFDTSHNGNRDAFVAKMQPALSGADGLVYATYLGGDLSERAVDIAVDGAGAAYVTGETRSADFPTTPGSFQPDTTETYDVFVVKMHPLGKSLIYGTYLGGDRTDTPGGIIVDAAGSAIVTGRAPSTFPTTPDAYRSNNTQVQAFLTRLNSDGSDLLYGGRIGGAAGNAEGIGIAIDPSGNVYIAGDTFTYGGNEDHFPTTPGAFQTTMRGNTDGFVAKFSIGAVGTGSNTPPPTATLTPTVTVTPTATATPPGGPGPQPPPVLPTVWYFAEGYTGAGFDQYFTIQNPNPTAAAVRLTYYLASGQTIVKTRSVAATSRATLVVHEAAEGVGRGQAVATTVESTNGVGIIVERPMYFTYGGSMGTVTGGHNVMGVTALRQDWHFAEGYTGQGFDEYLTILNPGAAGTATITYYVEGQATPTVRTVPLPAARRTTVTVHGAYDAATNPGGLGRLSVGHGTSVATSVPTVVERPIYFRYGSDVDGGHNVTGAASLGTSFLFAEGYTGQGFDEYLTIMNPGAAGSATITYYVEGQVQPIERTVALAAQSRTTVRVHLAHQPTTNPGGLGRLSAGHATSVETTVPVVVERPMYFQYGAAIDGGHNVMGAPEARPAWYFAEGYTGTGFDEYLTILNPTSSTAIVTIAYYLDSGASGAPVQLTVNANSRKTVAVHGTTEGVGRNKAVSARVEGSVGIVVERPMYFRYGATIDGGHNVMGHAP